LSAPTAATCVPGEIHSSITIGPRAGVIVTTTSAPRTTCSTSVEGRRSYEYRAEYFAAKSSSVACERLHTRTSSQSKTSLQVSIVPSAMLPAPTIASTFESLRASHFADTAAEAPVRITVWYEPSQIASGKPVSGCV
jgi:hypothetical protein